MMWLVEDIMETHAGHLSTGIFGTKYLACPSLTHKVSDLLTVGGTCFLC